MNAVNHIYGPETLISPNTNRPVTKVVKTSCPSYWCSVCSMRLFSPSGALQHIYGRPHKNKQFQKSQPDSNNGLSNEPVAKKMKHPPVQTVVSDPHFRFQVSVTTSVQHSNNHSSNTHQNVEQHLKEVNPVKPVVETSKDKTMKEDQAVVAISKCDECKLEFHNSTTAIQHFQGRRHLRNIATILEAKQSATMSMWQSRPPVGAPIRGGSGGRGRARGSAKRTGILTTGGPQSKLQHRAAKLEFATSALHFLTNQHVTATSTKEIGNATHTSNFSNKPINLVRNNSYGTSQQQTSNYDNAQLQSNSYGSTQLQSNSYGTSQQQTSNYDNAQLQSNSYDNAQQQNNSYGNAQLQSNSYGQLQSKSYENAQLQNNTYDDAQQQIKSYDNAQAQTTSCDNAQYQSSNYDDPQDQSNSYNNAHGQSNRHGTSQDQNENSSDGIAQYGTSNYRSLHENSINRNPNGYINQQSSSTMQRDNSDYSNQASPTTNQFVSNANHTNTYSNLIYQVNRDTSCS